jgi:hypothetical protein
VIYRVRRKDCERFSRRLANICNRGVDSDAGSRSDSRRIGAVLCYLMGRGRAFGTVAFKTSHGCFRVNDSNAATLPVDARWQRDESRLECSPWIWVR